MRIAVVGSGISGLGATWLLNEYSEHEVHLYEADSRPGGHANTVPFAQPGKEPVDVDTGFIVLNSTTYPNFLRFLRQCPSVEILPTDMTFSVSRDGGDFEWAGTSLRAVFCQPKRLLDPGMWRMLWDVLRFNACATALLRDESRGADETDDDVSIGVYLQREGYSNSFRDNYLIPMTAAIWSTPPDTCILDFPARTLIRFMHNHHLLQLVGRPPWLTIKGGSKKYVDAILSKLPPSQLHLSTPIRSIRQEPLCGPDKGKFMIETSTRVVETYDRVILACHSDQALEMLSDATDEEAKILGGFRWSHNEVILHSDRSLMPKNEITWSCWNYLTSSIVDDDGTTRANADQVALTYYMNDLQHLPLATHGPIFATLNAPHAPAPGTLVGRFAYAHPVLDARAVRLQAALPAIQGARGLWFAGAWTRYGFHEDGFRSGLLAARKVIESAAGGPGGKAAQLPFEIVSAEREVDVHPAAWVFGVLEGWGVRGVLGAVLSVWLAVARLALGGFLSFGDGARKTRPARKLKN